MVKHIIVIIILLLNPLLLTSQTGCTNQEIEGFSSPQYFNNSYYYISDNTMSWTEANELCGLLGGHLVTISNQEETDFIETIIVNNTSYWIGLFQNTCDPNFSEPNGSWGWVTGEELEYTDWLINEPNENTPGEHFGTIIYNDSTNGYTGWNDAHNADIEGIGTPQHAILEIPCTPTTINTFEGVCNDLLLDCMDPLACNYNPNANEDDGSCEYLDDCGYCPDNEIVGEYIPGFYSPQYYNGKYYYVSIWSGGDYANLNYEQAVSVTNNLGGQLANLTEDELPFLCEIENICCTGSAYFINNYQALNNPSNDDCVIINWPGTSSVDLNGNHQFIMEINACPILGCTDETACNYNPNANEDDGSCEYISPIDLGDDITTCEESIVLDAGEGYDSYSWSTGETTQSITVNESGNYSIEVLKFNELNCNEEDCCNNANWSPDGFNWVTNEEVDYLNWNTGNTPGEPDNFNGEECFVYNSPGGWIDAPDSASEQKLFVLEIISEIEPNIPDGFTELGNFEGSYYYLSTYSTSWTQAYYDCLIFGGQLVTITSEEEQNFLSSINNPYWIGFYIPSYNNTYSTCEHFPTDITSGDAPLSWSYLDIVIPENTILYSVYADFERPGYPESSHDFMIAYCSNCNFENIDSDFLPPEPYEIWDYDTIDYSLYNTELIISNISETEVVGPSTIRVLAPLWGPNDNWNDLCLTFISTCNAFDAINVEFGLQGCTDNTAVNYDMNAICDDGSCIYCGSLQVLDYGDYLDADDIYFDNTDGLTISLWVHDDNFYQNPEDFATYIDFGSQDSYRYVVRNRGGKIEAFFEGEDLPTNFNNNNVEWEYPYTAVSAGLIDTDCGSNTDGWHNVTAVYCATGIRIYIDGLIGSQGVTYVYFDQLFALTQESVKRIGNNQLVEEPADANIDEVRIWNRALSSEEVLERASINLNTSEEQGLIGYWKFDGSYSNEITLLNGSGNGVELTTTQYCTDECNISEYIYECSEDLAGNQDCNSCVPTEGCMDDGNQIWSPYPGFAACNYDPLAVINIIENCFYVQDDCLVEYPEYYDCECKCINDIDGDDICDEIDCSPTVYNPDQDCSNLDYNITFKKLIKTTDVLGREIDINTHNTLIFERYDDGSIEKRCFLK